MIAWCHLPTIFNRRYALRLAGLLTLCVALTTTLIFASVSGATAGVNQTLSFQGRLLDASGAVVPDGHYNIQFKIYQDGSGTAAGDLDGTLKWTETYLNNGSDGGVEVKDGFFSVNLGSNTPFGTSVDWNQDTLWLSMNVAGSSTSCTTFGTAPCAADGEMLPMKRITSTPYSLNSGQLDGKTASNFIQMAQGVQEDASTNTSSIFINKTGTGNLIQLQNTATDVFTVGNNGDLTLGSNADKTISVAVADADTAGSNLVVLAGDGGSGDGANGGNLTLQGGSAGGTNGDGGNIAINAGAGSGTGANGTVAIGGDHTDTIQLGNTSDAVTQTIGIGNNTTSGSATTVTIGSLQGSSATVINAGSGNIALNGAVSANGTVNASTGYSVGGTAGADLSCGANEHLENQTVQGGITTGGTCEADQLSNGVNLDGVNNIQVGDGDGSGTPTLLTLDTASSAPTVTDSALIGSMYYDTTLNELQCYEATGWGACTASPDDFVSLSPNYSGAVMHGSNLGTITSDMCSDALNINDGSSEQPTICGTNETYNYYNWASTEDASQTKSIFVTYQLPSSFKSFVSGATSLMARTDGSDADVSYQLYRNDDTGLTACGSATDVSTGTQTAWQKGTAEDTADPANCDFAAGDSIVVRIDLTAKNDANAYASTLNFAFSNH